MRRLVVSTFVSLDGVMQAPGGPEEDPTGGFRFGGWTFPFWSADMEDSMMGLDGKDRDIVLGRRTYEIFDAYWPYRSDDEPIAKTLNAARKYVASRTLKSVGWSNSTLLGDDVVTALSALKNDPGKDLQVIGSGNLVQTLHAASLVDEYNLLIFPVVLGQGKRLFESGAKPACLRLVASKTSSKGVVLNTYVPLGDVPQGSFAMEQPSAKEVERRAKMARSDGW